MKHFKISDFEVTSTNLPNKVNSDIVQGNIINLVDKVLDPLREAYGKPIKINSGYRSSRVNAAVGGAKNSQHLVGEAADITGGSAEENKKLFELIQKLDLPFDQLIDEKNYKWIHVGLSRVWPSLNQILHIN